MPPHESEIEYHERIYSGFAQSHFAKPAVAAFREHLADRILRKTGTGSAWRVLSLGCGIGDTELLLAPHVAGITGIDLSPSAIRQARADAARASAANVQFLEGTIQSLAPAVYDLIIAIFFLHHVPGELPDLARRIAASLKPGGVFYSLDPSRYRLSGAIGDLFFPKIMRRYQSPNETPLAPAAAAAHFEGAGLEAHLSYYDFLSTPLAGLFPSWRAGYRASRAVDELLIRTPLLRRLSSNFEITARIGKK